MGHTLTIRLTPEQAKWLSDLVEQTGIPAGRFIREQLERAKNEAGRQKFLSLAGQISGEKNLSSRKGFSTKEA